MMSSIFSKIIKGEIPSHKIAENDRFYAFLDVFPLVPGHTLVVPKIETDYIFDLSDEELREILSFSRPIAKAIEKACPCKRCGIAVIGLEVPHAHVHLVPMNSADDLNFTREKLKPTQEELQQAQSMILAHLS
jgi:histidine triad (HIT) family protein